MKISFKKNEIQIYLEMLILFFVFRFEGILKYFIFFAYLMYKFGISSLKVKKKFWILCSPAFICAIWGTILSILNRTFNIETVKENIFIILPVFGACIILNMKDSINRKQYIYCIFWAIVMIFIIMDIPKFTFEDLAESTYAFVFGIYVLYFFYEKEILHLGVAFLCCILAGKRIVWGTVILGSIGIILLSKKSKKQKDYYKQAQMLVVGIGIICLNILLLYVYFCKVGLIDTLMYKSGINSMGRLNVWNYFSEYYSFSPYYLGIGFGGVKNLLNTYNSEFFGRLHNDILMYYIELGFWGFLVYFSSFFSIFYRMIKQRKINYSKAVLLVILITYTYLCYCTDNISIYISYLFPFYLVLGTCLFREDELIIPVP